jgi:hypothetical protein
MMMTSTGVFARVLAVHNPPKPAPMITTRGGVFERRAEMTPSMVELYAAWALCKTTPTTISIGSLPSARAGKDGAIKRA